MGSLFLVLAIIHAVKEMFRTRDYTIRKVLLEYSVSDGEASMNEFWKQQKINWVTLPDIFTVDVKNKTFLPLPSCIQKPLLKITYVFNSREYVYMTDDLQYTWPPKKVTTMSFVLPYKNVTLMNSEGVPVKNITREFNQIAGPRFDFHGAQVALIDMIEKPFTKIRLTNIMNQQSVISLCG
jgi:hypothetical protein